MIKLGVSGAGGTGKSTLAQAISHRYNIPLINEHVREWLKIHGYSTPWQLPWSKQIVLQKSYLKYKIENESCKNGFVSDRTTLDSVILLILRYSSLIQLIKLTDVITSAVIHAKKTYDFVVVPHYKSLPYQNDKCGNIDQKIRRKEYFYTIFLCKILRIPVIKVTESDLNERLKRIEKTIQKHFKGCVYNHSSFAPLKWCKTF